MADDARNASGTPAPTASHAGHSGGHVVSSRATAVGLMAIVLWSFMAGTVRIVAESFGATLGSALIYTVGGVLLLVFRRPAPIREFPKKYLIIGGLLFVFYESSISLSLGLASTAASSVEVSLVNYLWPTMMVLLAAGVSRRRHAVWKVLPGAIVATVGVALAVGGNSGLDWQAAAGHIADNPLPYVLAFAGALAWSVYAVFTPAWSHGVTVPMFPNNSCIVDYPFCFRAGLACRAAESGRMAVRLHCGCRNRRWLCLLGLRHSARLDGAAGHRLLCHAGALHWGQCGAIGIGVIVAVLVRCVAGGRWFGAELSGQRASLRPHHVVKSPPRCELPTTRRLKTA